MKRQRMNACMAVALVVGMFAMPVAASSSYASSAFQAQWQQGEAITANFWGPLPLAHDGQQEPYKEAPGGSRLVQYFDKGRMELTNGAVTNGLLATEIVKGQIQTGDATFQPQTPPSIPIAGDPDNAGPTYAQLSTKGKGLFEPAPQQTGNVVQASVLANGDVIAGNALSSGPATFAAFDDTTQHNVTQAFADYRARAGLASIGYALAEPFYATVRVGGAPKQVIVQVFERRVLTYTPSNPDAFRVEMGNIGQHYYAWHYPNGAPAVSAPPVSSAPYGGKIAYSTRARGPEADSDVLVMNPDGTGRVHVAKGITPQFSPDGKRVAYYTRVEEPPNHYSTLVRSVAIDGSGVQDIGYVFRSVVAYGGAGVRLRRWSPDGRTIVLTVTQNAGAGAVQLFDVPSKTPSTSLAFAQGNVYGFVDWTPSGGAAIWQASIDYPDKKEIYIGDPTTRGSNAAQLTHGQNRIGYKELPDWFYSDARISPDGKSIAVVGSKLFIVSVPGQQSLFDGRSFDVLANATSIAWSPDGRAIAATLENETQSKLVIVDIASGNVVYSQDGVSSVDWSRQ